MNIKIDDKKVVHFVTLIYTKDGITNKIEIHSTTKKNAKDSLSAMEEAVIDLQKKHMKVVVLARSVHDLTPSMFLDDEKITKPVTKLTKIK